MNPTRRAVNDSRAAGRALSMMLLMLLMSMAPLLTVPTVSAHAEPSGVTWPLEGSNDTGWVKLNAVGANTPGEGAQATADWNLSFAPGAQLSNVTLEIRVSGEDGMVIEEPLLAVDVLGVFGAVALGGRLGDLPRDAGPLHPPQPVGFVRELRVALGRDVPLAIGHAA